MSAPSEPWAGDVQELEKRVDQLENQGGEQKGSVRTFLADQIHLGGFITASSVTQFGKATTRQSTFDEGHFDLQISVDATDRLMLMTETEFKGDQPLQDENAAWRSYGTPRTAFDLHMAHGRYHFNDAFMAEFGRLKAPFGIINVEHFEGTFLTHAKPQAFRTTSATNFALFEIHGNGVQILGTVSPGGHTVGYHVGAMTVRSDSRAIGAGGRLFWNTPSGLLKLGVSNQTAQRGDQTYSALGTDAKLAWKNLTLQTEFLRGVIQAASDQTSFYVQPSYSLFDEKFLLFGRIDYLDDTLGTRTVDHDQVAATAAIADPIKKFEYTGGINYLPWAFMRNRLEFTLHDYRGATAALGGLDRDYYAVQLSSTVTF